MDRMHAPNAVEADLAPPTELILRYPKASDRIDSGRITGNPEVISSPVGLVPINALGKREEF